MSKTEKKTYAQKKDKKGKIYYKLQYKIFELQITSWFI